MNMRRTDVGVCVNKNIKKCGQKMGMFVHACEACGDIGEIGDITFLPFRYETVLN